MKADLKLLSSSANALAEAAAAAAESDNVSEDQLAVVRRFNLATKASGSFLTRKRKK